MALPVVLPPAASSEPAAIRTTPAPARPLAGPSPSNGDGGSTGGLALAPPASWRVPEGCVWRPVPQGKKKSPVYAYFVCEYRTDGGAVMDSTRYICVQNDHKGHPVRVAHCKVTANLKQHLVGKHGVIVSSAHLGGRAAGECSSGSGGGQRKHWLNWFGFANQLGNPTPRLRYPYICCTYVYRPLSIIDNIDYQSGYRSLPISFTDKINY